MRTTLILALALSAASSPLAAQTSFDPHRNQAIGGMAGLASGSGLSYQEIYPSAYGYRGALALWKAGDSFFLNTGISGLRILTDDGRQRVYLVGGLSYWRHTEETSRPIFDENDNVTGERIFDDVDDSWSMGLGAGIELPVGTRTAISLEALFTYWTQSSNVLPLPQIGLQYQF